MIPDLDHYLPVNAGYIKAVRWGQLPEKARLNIPPQMNALYVLFNREGQPLLMCDSRAEALTTARISETVIFTVH